MDWFWAQVRRALRGLKAIAIAWGKYQHLGSKRDYYWWKDNLIADILESL
jgi:hypothetical protein